MWCASIQTSTVQPVEEREMAMKTNPTMSEMERRAVEALQALLGQVSVIKLKEIRVAPLTTGDTGIVARVDVLGHRHTLTCEVRENAQPQNLRETLQRLHDGAARCGEPATPVLIAPYLSPEAQALCKESHAGFLDLEGNARLTLGEAFIGKRSRSVRNTHRSTAAYARPATASAQRLSLSHAGNSNRTLSAVGD
jgi:hypothetical protein